MTIVQPEPLEDEQLSEELAEIVRGVTGVIALYSAQPLVTGIAQVVAGVVTRQPSTAQLVRIDQDDTGLTVLAVIGTVDSEPAAVVARRAHDAIHSHLDLRAGVSAVHVRVKVGRVQ